MIEIIFNASWGEIFLAIAAIGFAASLVGVVWQQVWPIIKKEED